VGLGSCWLEPVRCAPWKNLSSESALDHVHIQKIGFHGVRIEYYLMHDSTNSNYSIQYEVYGDGRVKVIADFNKNDESLPELPRFGLQLLVPAGLDSVMWFGRGPNETYWDRKTGAAIDLYKGTVWEQYFPYVRPQENGNKTDVRWLALYNHKGTGLMAVANSTISTSVQQFYQDDLDHPEKGNPHRHINDIRPRNIITWNIDYKQMGVGGDNSWGARTHEKYTLKAKNYTFSFILVPFDKGKTDPVQINKYNYE